MAARRSCFGECNWVSMLFCVYMALSLGGFASAALLGRRQASKHLSSRLSLLLPTIHVMLTRSSAGDFSAEHPNDSDASDLLTSAAATAPVPTAAVEPNANGTAASNGTAKASSLSSAAAIATTASSPLNSTNDPHMCHIEHKANSEGVSHIDNPFCKPSEGQQVHPNIQYEGTSQHAIPSYDARKLNPP